MWLCGEGGLKEDLGIFMAFNKFVVKSWNGELSFGKVCGVTLYKSE